MVGVAVFVVVVGGIRFRHGAPLKDNNDNTVAAVVTNGFEVRFGSDLTEYYKQYWYTNRSDNTYRYFALG